MKRFDLFKFSTTPRRPYVIAGPCTAESYELMQAVATHLLALAKELDFELIFKASFDKANRTSVDSYRGPGLKTALGWFASLKDKYQVLCTTDVHESAQVEAVAEVCDLIQIPAFLCRQTDLIVAAVKTTKAVSVKKGQFLAPENASHIVSKVHSAAEHFGTPTNLALIERGSSFGYGNLVVDMRGFKTMAQNAVPLIFDITHSTQKPSTDKVTGGMRDCAPLLARAATATGYLSGYFLEVHLDPKNAKSDAATQLSLRQSELLLRQVIPMWEQSRGFAAVDQHFD
jgi:2-dehydro-3-deoxyphosphooctonate aldolase (KDO 8-P synthase)